MNETDNRSLESDRIKGVLFRWTDESARWYEEASQHTGYHNRLEEIIAPHLDESWRCCELACGTGTLARHLAPHVSAYTANDLDPHAMEHLRRMNAKDPIPGLYCAGNDANTIYGNSYPFYLCGNTSSFALNSGRLAGKAICKQLL